MVSDDLELRFESQPTNTKKQNICRCWNTTCYQALGGHEVSFWGDHIFCSPGFVVSNRPFIYFFLEVAISSWPLLLTKKKQIFLVLNCAIERTKQYQFFCRCQCPPATANQLTVRMSLCVSYGNDRFARCVHCADITSCRHIGLTFRIAERLIGNFASLPCRLPVWIGL